MSTWKIIRNIDNKDTVYLCYRRYWFFFWKLKKIMTQQNYDKLCKMVENNGYNVRELFKHDNF